MVFYRLGWRIEGGSAVASGQKSESTTVGAFLLKQPTVRPIVRSTLASDLTIYGP